MRLKSIVLLSRPLNLLIVAVTMFISRYVLLADVLRKQGNVSLKMSGLHFGALVLGALLITAAGNVINDYFDQKVDKINKPEKVIVGRGINRKMAILIHQGLNALAVGLVLWVGISSAYIELVIVPLLIMFLLWWYSPVFKKRPIIGNALVAFCTAVVPVFAVLPDMHLLKSELASSAWNGMSVYTYAWLWVLGVALFAFVLTMIREAVKDAQDEPGDRAGNYQTIPILWGMQRTKRYVTGWMVVFLIMAGWCLTRIETQSDMLWLIACLIVPMLPAVYFVNVAKSPSDFGKVSRWIKFVMLGGLLAILAVLG